MRLSHSLLSQRGITLTELLVVLTIIFILCGVATSSFSSFIQKARASETIADIRFIERQINQYKEMRGSYPVSLETIGLGHLRDQWGNPYVYVRVSDVKGKGKLRKDRFMNPLNTDYDLYSCGPDGQTTMQLTAKNARDDIVRAGNGDFVGIASDY